MPGTAVLPDQKTKRILIIEDEGEMCLILNMILDSKDMELDHVKTLQSASEYLQKQNPSVVILDNQLPDGLGVDFINYLKLYHPQVRIIMISGYGASAKDIALENGADAFLEKPFTREQIYNTIERLLS
ncbi:MAG TPA: response regulator [Chitinophagaceae bacterium]|jgi:DNA-binding NtrC family response regulator|nr:response regulator [Chitinophagaceae bacterium]